MSWAQRSVQRTVAADAEKDLDVHALERFDHHHLVLPAAGASQHGAADFVDAVDRVGGQHHRLVAECGNQSLIAVADAEDDRHVVAEHQGTGQSLDDVVESGAEPARGQNRGMSPGRIMVDLRARSGLLEGAQRAGGLVFFNHLPGILSVDDGGVFGDETDPVERRIDRRLTEVLYCKIGVGHSSVSPVRGPESPISRNL